MVLIFYVTFHDKSMITLSCDKIESGSTQTNIQRRGIRIIFVIG